MFIRSSFDFDIIDLLDDVVSDVRFKKGQGSLLANSAAQQNWKYLGDKAYALSMLARIKTNTPTPSRPRQRYTKIEIIMIHRSAAPAALWQK